MKPEEFKKSWEWKQAVVVFNDGERVKGQIIKTNPADNDEEEGNTVFIQIWQPDRIIEEPIETVKEIKLLE